MVKISSKVVGQSHFRCFPKRSTFSLADGSEFTSGSFGVIKDKIVTYELSSIEDVDKHQHSSLKTTSVKQYDNETYDMQQHRGVITNVSGGKFKVSYPSVEESFNGKFSGEFPISSFPSAMVKDTVYLTFDVDDNDDDSSKEKEQLTTEQKFYRYIKQFSLGK